MLAVAQCPIINSITCERDDATKHALHLVVNTSRQRPVPRQTQVGHACGNEAVPVQAQQHISAAPEQCIPTPDHTRGAAVLYMRVMPHLPTYAHEPCGRSELQCCSDDAVCSVPRPTHAVDGWPACVSCRAGCGNNSTRRTCKPCTAVQLPQSRHSSAHGSQLPSTATC
jgi:hypothetical protein